MRSNRTRPSRLALGLAALVLPVVSTLASAQSTAGPGVARPVTPPVMPPTPPGGTAFDIALFGNNCTDDFLSQQGFQTTIVTDLDLQVPGFLDQFDALVVTRNDGNFGHGLSLAAAPSVVSWVGTDGAVVLFPGDWADMVTTASCNLENAADVNVATLFCNAVTWAAQSGHGYIGEFNGTAMAMTTNSSNFLPLDLMSGNAGTLGTFSAAVDTVSLTPTGTGHPITEGVVFPFSPVEPFKFRTAISSALDGNVLATWADGVPALLASRSLVLDAAPNTVTAGQLLTLSTTGGAPGLLGLLAAVDVNGLSLFLILDRGPFDGSCRRTLAAPTPPGLAGITVTFRSLGFTKAGVLEFSNPSVVDFQ